MSYFWCIIQRIDSTIYWLICPGKDLRRTNQDISNETKIYYSDTILLCSNTVHFVDSNQYLFFKVKFSSFEVVLLSSRIIKDTNFTFLFHSSMRFMHSRHAVNKSSHFRSTSMFVSFSFLTSLVTKTGGSLNLMDKKATSQQITLERCHMLKTIFFFKSPLIVFI